MARRSRSAVTSLTVVDSYTALGNAVPLEVAVVDAESRRAAEIAAALATEPRGLRLPGARCLALNASPDDASCRLHGPADATSSAGRLGFERQGLRLSKGPLRRKSRTFRTTGWRETKPPIRACARPVAGSRSAAGRGGRLSSGAPRTSWPLWSGGMRASVPRMSAVDERRFLAGNAGRATAAGTSAPRALIPALFLEPLP